MEQLIFHIGTHKTGSTALQTCLMEYKDLLGERGIGYYVPSRPFYNRSAGNATFLFRGVALKEENRPWRFWDPRGEREYERFCAYAASYRTVILSGEGAWRAGAAHPSYWERLRKLLQSSFGEDLIIKTVVYLRRQDRFLYSLWKQVIKEVTTCDKDFDRWMLDHLSDGTEDYKGLVERLCAVFGREQVIVRRYGRDDEKDWDICRDFIEATGLPLREGRDYAKQEANPSSTLAAALAMAAVRRGEAGAVEAVPRRRSIVATELFSAMYPEDKDLYPLPPAQRQELVRIHEEGNRALAREFLGEERLFSDVETDYPVAEIDPEKVRRDAQTLARLLTLPRARLLRLREALEKSAERETARGSQAGAQ